MSDIGPDILAQLREEERHVDITKKGERRVKLERGQTWKIRFLPAKLGPRKSWYARISRHWVNMKPVVCPVQTHPDFGGNPDAYCPACEMAKVLNDNADEAVSKFGFKSRANDNWLTYCIVLDKNGMETDANDLLLPYEFNLYVNNWEELKGFFKGGYTKKNPLSVLDYRLGNIMSVTKTARGLRLDKLDQCEIYDASDSDHFNACIQRLEANIKMPKVVIPTVEQLEVFAQKMEDAAFKTEGASPSSRRPAPPVADDPLEESEPADAPAPAPARRPAPAAAAPAARRPAPAPATAPRPAAPTARAAAPAPRPAAPRPRPAPVEDEQPPLLDGDTPPPPEDSSNPELNPMPLEETEPPADPEGLDPAMEAAVPEEEAQDAPPPPPVRRPAPLPARAPVATRPAAPRPAAPVRSAAPVASRGQKLAPMPEAAGAPDEGAEEEQLPEEANDQAPPAEVVDEQPLEPPPPPPVARKGAAPAGRLGDAVKARVAAIAKRESAQ